VAGNSPLKSARTDDFNSAWNEDLSQKTLTKSLDFAQMRVAVESLDLQREVIGETSLPHDLDACRDRHDHRPTALETTELAQLPVSGDMNGPEPMAPGECGHVTDND
jgi:hypothetical protein